MGSTICAFTSGHGSNLFFLEGGVEQNLNCSVVDALGSPIQTLWERYIIFPLGNTTMSAQTVYTPLQCLPPLRVLSHLFPLGYNRWPPIEHMTPSPPM